MTKRLQILSLAELIDDIGRIEQDRFRLVGEVSGATAEWEIAYQHYTRLHDGFMYTASPSESFLKSADKLRAAKNTLDKMRAELEAVRESWVKAVGELESRIDSQQ